MYSERAKAARRCTATRKNGEPCTAYACWDDSRQRCVQHAGRGHRGPQRHTRTLEKPTAYVPCTCAAYNWPHRPGSGICCWPDPPRYHRTTPAGTHSWWRCRTPFELDLKRAMHRIERLEARHGPE